MNWDIDTTATVTMEHVAAGWTMTGIHLDVIAWVPRVVQCDFIDAAVRAKASCSISRLLHAKVSMFAKLETARGRIPAPKIAQEVEPGFTVKGYFLQSI